jgi:hypothetical protein
MALTSAQQLQQYLDKSNAEQSTSNFANYQKEVAARPKGLGMINFNPETASLKFKESDMSYWATPQAPAPASGGMSVMCTLMREYGYLEDNVFIADTLFGNLLVQTNPEIIAGYHAWAKPLTAFLRNNAIYIPLFAYIVQAWAYEMAEEFGIIKNRSTFKRLVGKIVMNIGKPICGFIGTIISSSQGSYEYHRT